MSSLSGAQYEADAPGPGLSQSRASALLRQAQAGDRAAYAQIAIAYQDRLYNAALRLVGDAEEARDLTQEAFVRGLDHLDGFRGEAAPYTWFFRIVMNLAITRLRQVQRRRTFSLDAGNGMADRLPQRDAAGPLDALEARERGQQVLFALGRLDPDQRALLVMRDVEGFDYAQMAALLDLPLGTLKSRLFRARLALREQLQSYLESP